MLEAADLRTLSRRAMNLSRLSARNCTSLPARSSRMKVKPPEVPTPGIAGGEKLKAIPSGSFDSSWFRCCLIVLILLLAGRCGRSIPSRVTKKKAL